MIDVSEAIRWRFDDEHFTTITSLPSRSTLCSDSFSKLKMNPEGSQSVECERWSVAIDPEGLNVLGRLPVL
jgi:hypothetical protein